MTAKAGNGTRYRFSPVVAREVPANPNVRVYHVAEELTREIVLVFGARSARRPPEWLAPVVADPRVREVDFTRYRVRVMKADAAAWDAIEPAVERALLARFGAERVEPAPDAAESVLNVAKVDGPRRVFEGVASAEGDEIARRLFAIAGVAEVVLSPEGSVVVKGRAFPREDVLRAVKRVLPD